MSKTEELKQKYVKDADAMATKSRFGFFTLPPSHTAAHTDNPSNPRTTLSIQLLEIKTEEWSPSLQISTVEPLQTHTYRRTFSHIFPHPSMGLLMKTPARMSEENNFNSRKSKKGKRSLDQ